MTLNVMCWLVKQFRQTDQIPSGVDGLRQPGRGDGLMTASPTRRWSRGGWFADGGYSAGRGGRSGRVSLKRRTVAPIFLLAPTTPEARIAKVGEMAAGYVYYVSLRGVTGAANLDMSEVAARLPLIRQHVKLPIGVGFGIRDGATAVRWANRRCRGNRQPAGTGNRGGGRCRCRDPGFGTGAGYPQRNGQGISMTTKGRT